ncbi:hypothetical protein OG349_16465 [Streptomyces sp. NBC_01317]|uniref:hypothetical protein n=1 Tax=Streptomyces sp. NBC_01317 TaxID=2903822 RepID=UPI002E111913|nr:hypothetical protein OG349_16465 [Streptomyces sp. NBC_01317]
MRNVGVVMATAAIVTLATSPTAWASWETNASTVWSDGNMSREWSDEEYNEIKFKDCGTVTTKEIEVERWQLVTWGLDTLRDDFTFTNCFNGTDAVSADTQSNLPAATYYFQTDTTCASCVVSVRKIVVDTTQAD